jgi:polyhydroxybutyrate depolymerase
MQTAFKLMCTALAGGLLACASAVTAAGLQPLTLTVAGQAREALVYLPPGTNAAPVVFAFHGHGGNARQAARSFGFEKLWPEAAVVYMQGLPTPGRLTDPEGKLNGWQREAGDQDDRDLKFFAALLAELHRRHPLDDRRLYATGHSNGGAFTYLLWASRPAVFAAFAPSAAAFRGAAALKPKPGLHVAGEQDPLVRFAWQQLTMAAVRRANGCDAAGQPWAPGCTLYPSTRGTPFVSFIHPGTHQYPPEAPALIVRFFKEH